MCHGRDFILLVNYFTLLRDIDFIKLKMLLILLLPLMICTCFVYGIYFVFFRFGLFFFSHFFELNDFRKESVYSLCIYHENTHLPNTLHVTYTQDFCLRTKVTRTRAGICTDSSPMHSLHLAGWWGGAGAYVGSKRSA